MTNGNSMNASDPEEPTSTSLEEMPELGWRLGYPFALSLMVLITVVGYRYFKRKDWL